MSNKILRTIFSINNVDFYKIITIFGFKIKIFRKKYNGSKENLRYGIMRFINTNPKLAKKIFDLYYEKFGLIDIEKNLHLSFFAKENNKRNEAIDKSAYIYQKIMQNNDYQKLKEYFKDKSIAFVGNSGRELGKNNGKEIDSHDVVIRFNNYPSNYIDDYGQKCNFWVRGYGLENEIKDRDLNQFDYVLFGSGLLDVDMKDYIINWTYEKLQLNHNNILTIPYSFYLNCEKDFGVKYPTNGFITITFIKSLLPNKKIDIYGFSFLDDNNDDNSHFYDDKANLKSHSFDEERDCLRQMFTKGKVK